MLKLHSCSQNSLEDNGDIALECFDRDQATQYLNELLFKLYLVTNYIEFDDIE